MLINYTTVMGYGHNLRILFCRCIYLCLNMYVLHHYNGGFHASDIFHVLESPGHMLLVMSIMRDLLNKRSSSSSSPSLQQQFLFRG